MIKLSVKSSGNIQSNLRAVQERMARKVERAVLAGAEVLKDKAREIVPEDTVYLAATIRAYLTEEGLQAKAIVGAGGEDWLEEIRVDHHGKMVRRKPSRYARAVHQGLTGHIPRNGKQSNFLGGPAMTEQDAIREAIRAALGEE